MLPLTIVSFILLPLYFLEEKIVSEISILLKLLYYSRQSTDSMQSLSNYQGHFSQNWNKNILKSIWKHKALNRQNNPEKEKQSWRNQMPWFQTILQTTVIKIVWYWHKKMKSLEISPTLLLSINPWQKRQECTEKRQSFQ